MNHMDNEDCKALKFLTEERRSTIKSWNDRYDTSYQKIVPKDVERRLIKEGLIDLKGKSDYIITDSGRKRLRELQVMYWKYLSLVLSVISLIISILALLQAGGKIDIF